MGRFAAKNRRRSVGAFWFGLVLSACGGLSQGELSNPDGRAGNGDSGRAGSHSNTGGTSSGATGDTGFGGTLSTGGSGAKATGGTNATGGTGGTSSGGSVSAGAATSSGGTGTGGTGTGGTGTGGGTAGSRSCTYGGIRRTLGSTYPAGDGCNECTCTSAGSDCTSMACGENTCDAITREYADATITAQKCVPGLADQCPFITRSTLGCSCYIPVNDVSELATLETYWYGASCDAAPRLPCVTCVPLDRFGYCAANGRCEETPVGGAGGGGASAGAAGTDAAGAG